VRCLSGGISKLFLVDNETLKKVAALFGENAVRVIEALKEVHEISDSEIADRTKIRPNMVRKALYGLYDHSLHGSQAIPRSRNRLVYLQLGAPTRPPRRLQPKPKAPCSRKTGNPAWI